MMKTRQPSRKQLSNQILTNQWARDDPAFVLILVLFMTCAALAFTVAYGEFNFWHFIRIVLGSVFIEFLGVGFMIATIGW